MTNEQFKQQVGILKADNVAQHAAAKVDAAVEDAAAEDDAVKENTAAKKQST